MHSHLFGVTPPKLFPARWIVRMPLAQFRAGCEIFDPLVQLSLRFCHAAWPEAIDQYAAAIVGRGRFVGTLQFDVCRGNSLCHAVLPLSFVERLFGLSLRSDPRGAATTKSLDLYCAPFGRGSRMTSAPNDSQFV